MATIEIPTVRASTILLIVAALFAGGAGGWGLHASVALPDVQVTASVDKAFNVPAELVDRMMLNLALCERAPETPIQKAEQESACLQFLKDGVLYITKRGFNDDFREAEEA